MDRNRESVKMNDYNIILLYLYICDPVYVLVIIGGGGGAVGVRRAKCVMADSRGHNIVSTLAAFSAISKRRGSGVIKLARDDS